VKMCPFRRQRWLPRDAEWEKERDIKKVLKERT